MIDIFIWNTEFYGFFLSNFKRIVIGIEKEDLVGASPKNMRTPFCAENMLLIESQKVYVSIGGESFGKIFFFFSICTWGSLILADVSLLVSVNNCHKPPHVVQ